MTKNQEKAIKLIGEQQAKYKQFSPQHCVGEQLKDICMAEPASAELIAQDLAVKEMSIGEAEKKIREFASKHREGNCGVCPPREADRILREFYGLQPAAKMQQMAENAAKPQQTTFLDFDDLI